MWITQFYLQITPYTCLCKSVYYNVHRCKDANRFAHLTTGDVDHRRAAGSEAEPKTETSTKDDMIEDFPFYYLFIFISY